MLSRYSLREEAPSPQAFNALRVAVGWDVVDVEMAQKSLANSLFHVVMWDQQRLIGMARVIGDGQMYFYIQDVVVDPAYQQQGIGQALMERVEAFLSTAASAGATIGLLAAKGKEGFYQRHGYLERNGENLGRGMCRFVKNK